MLKARANVRLDAKRFTLAMDDFNNAIDLMKIDVEGFEPNVIEGAREAIESKKIHSILLEFNKYWLECNGSSVASLYQKLLASGFKPKNKNIDINSSLQNLFFSME